MTVSPAVTALVKAYQSFYQLPQDGFIGWGHRITGEYEVRDYAEGIDTSEAERLLALDIEESEAKILALTQYHANVLSQAQYDALVSLSMDATNFRGAFLLKHALNQDTDLVAKEFTKWGKALPGTELRRAAELRLFKTGTFIE